MRVALAVAAAAVALVMAGRSADAQGVQSGVIGTWSSEQGCGAQSRQFVFRGNSMELWDGNQRLFVGDVRYQVTGNQTAITVVSTNAPQLPGNPEAGDVAIFRRDGSRLHAVAVTRNGERRTAPDGTPPFYLCPRGRS